MLFNWSWMIGLSLDFLPYEWMNSQWMDAWDCADCLSWPLRCLVQGVAYLTGFSESWSEYVFMNRKAFFCWGHNYGCIMCYISLVFIRAIKAVFATHCSWNHSGALTEISGIYGIYRVIISWKPHMAEGSLYNIYHMMYYLFILVFMAWEGILY